MKRRMAGRPRGFTLVEVVVVLAILGMLAGVVVPAIRGATLTDPVSAAGEEVRQVLQTARRIALEQARVVTVLIDPSHATYSVVKDQDPPGPPSILRLGSGVRVEGSALRARMTFQANGGASGDSLRVVGAGSVLFVSVDPWTGATNVRRPE